MTGKTLMIQGTSSSVGKSLLVAALCRIFARQGIRVAPFKAQNMSNNAAVCADGGEIGRSQALQAAAARVTPVTDMNPILLKPEADSRSQLIVNGRRWQTLPAGRYYRQRDTLWPVVTGALDRLRGEYDLVVIEGAGSPAELNLHDVEIVNMAVARYADAPVILAGDVDRGGVFAQLLGTLWLLGDRDRRLVRGLLVNKFRGDPRLFAEGVDLLEQRSGRPVLGVVPWIPNLSLPEEDAVALESPPSADGSVADSSAYAPHARFGVRRPGVALDSLFSLVRQQMSRCAGAFWKSAAGGRTSQTSKATPGRRTPKSAVDIAVIRFPRIANFDDFDPLAGEPGVGVRYVESAPALGQPDVVILPGTKSTIDDLHWLRASGLAERILHLADRGTGVIGICGGYQMLGRCIRDPHGTESPVEEIEGLGLLPSRTVYSRTKETRQVQATVVDDLHASGCRGQTLSGYEIHMGQTRGARPWLQISEPSGRPASATMDGDVDASGRVWGCYLHGLFANDRFRRAWLNRLRTGRGVPSAADGVPWPVRIDESLDRLADAVADAIDLEKLQRIVEVPVPLGG